MPRSMSVDQNGSQADSVVRSSSCLEPGSDQQSRTEGTAVDVSGLLSLMLSMKKYAHIFHGTLSSLRDTVPQCDLPNADFLTPNGYDILKSVLESLSAIASGPPDEPIPVTEFIEQVISVDRADTPEGDPYPDIWGSKTRDLYNLWLRLRRVTMSRDRDEYSSALRVLVYSGVRDESLPNSAAVTSDVLANLERVWVALERFYHNSRSSLVDAIEGDLKNHGLGSSVQDFAKFVSTKSVSRNALAYQSYSYDGTMKNHKKGLPISCADDYAALHVQQENLAPAGSSEHGSPMLETTKAALHDYEMGGTAIPESTTTGCTLSVDECEKVTAHTTETSKDAVASPMPTDQLKENRVACVSSTKKDDSYDHLDAKATVPCSHDTEKESTPLRRAGLDGYVSLDDAAFGEIECFLNSSSSARTTVNSSTGSVLYSTRPSKSHKLAESQGGPSLSTCEDITEDRKDGRSSVHSNEYDGQRRANYSSDPQGVVPAVVVDEENRQKGSQLGCTVASSLENSRDDVSNDVGDTAAVANEKSGSGEALASAGLCDKEHGTRDSKVVRKHSIVLAQKTQNGDNNDEVENCKTKRCKIVSPLVCESIGTPNGFDRGVSADNQRLHITESGSNGAILIQKSPVPEIGKGKKVLTNKGMRSSRSWKRQLSVIIALFCAVFLFVLAIVTAVGVSTPYLSSFITSPTSLIVTFALLLGMSGICGAIALCCSNSVAWGWSKENSVNDDESAPNAQTVSHKGGDVAASVCVKDDGESSDIQHPEAVDAVLSGDVTRHHSGNSYVRLYDEDRTSILSGGISVTCAGNGTEESLMLMPVPRVARC